MQKKETDMMQQKINEIKKKEIEILVSSLTNSINVHHHLQNG